MNKLSTLIAATLLIAAGAASAQTEAAPLTRAAVVAELVAARNSGELEVIQGVQGAEARPKIAQTSTTSKLPRQAVLANPSTEWRADQKTASALAADHGENAARELGDFPAPVARRAPVMAGR